MDSEYPIQSMLRRMKNEIEAIERLRAEHEMLREALKPFAEAWLERETWEAQINIDDLRAAHKAYGSCCNWQDWTPSSSALNLAMKGK